MAESSSCRLRGGWCSGTAVASAPGSREGRGGYVPGPASAPAARQPQLVIELQPWHGKKVLRPGQGGGAAGGWVKRGTLANCAPALAAQRAPRLTREKTSPPLRPTIQSE